MVSREPTGTTRPSRSARAKPPNCGSGPRTRPRCRARTGRAERPRWGCRWWASAGEVCSNLIGRRRPAGQTRVHDHGPGRQSCRTRQLRVWLRLHLPVLVASTNGAGEGIPRESEDEWRSVQDRPGLREHSQVRGLETVAHDQWISRGAARCPPRAWQSLSIFLPMIFLPKKSWQEYYWQEYFLGRTCEGGECDVVFVEVNPLDGVQFCVMQETP